MKIQSTHNKQHLKKAQKKQTPSASFGDMLNATSMENTQTETEQSIQPNADKQSHGSNPQQTLETHMQALEDALQTLEKEPQNSEHIQQTIVDLRQALQQSQLTPQALEDADTLLAVEAKRLASLSRKTP
ncbi:MAG: hypothetical protein Q9M75_10355 [Ghiorsea sp.]|nr:hypothetical protein [Ghiorsea sp.]